MSDQTHSHGKLQHGTDDKGLAALPKKGDRYKCHVCPMTLEITAECACKTPNDVHFHCCGCEMDKV